MLKFRFLEICIHAGVIPQNVMFLIYHCLKVMRSNEFHLLCSIKLPLVTAYFLIFSSTSDKIFDGEILNALAS